MRREQVRLDPAGAHVELLGKGRKERVVPLWAETRPGGYGRGSAKSAAMATASRSLGSAARRCRATAWITYSAAPSSHAVVACPSLAAKKVSPHVLRHSTAMHLFQAGVDMAVIALWLGHESLETTHVYVEADLATKELALEKLAPIPSMPAHRTGPTTNPGVPGPHFDYAALTGCKESGELRLAVLCSA